VRRGATDLGDAFADGPDEARRADVTSRLQAFNRAHLTDDAAREPLELYVLDPTGGLVGGLVGGIVWGWLEVAVLWVDEAHRGRGLGEALMRRAEAEARRRGCTAARLSTWDFQALGFYQRLGYGPTAGSTATRPAGPCTTSAGSWRTRAPSVPATPCYRRSRNRRDVSVRERLSGALRARRSGRPPAPSRADLQLASPAA